MASALRSRQLCFNFSQGTWGASLGPFPQFLSLAVPSAAPDFLSNIDCSDMSPQHTLAHRTWSHFRSYSSESKPQVWAPWIHSWPLATSGEWVTHGSSRAYCEPKLHPGPLANHLYGLGQITLPQGWFPFPCVKWKCQYCLNLLCELILKTVWTRIHQGRQIPPRIPPSSEWHEPQGLGRGVWKGQWPGLPDLVAPGGRWKSQCLFNLPVVTSC